MNSGCDYAGRRSAPPRSIALSREVAAISAEAGELMEFLHLCPGGRDLLPPKFAVTKANTKSNTQRKRISIPVTRRAGLVLCTAPMNSAPPEPLLKPASKPQKPPCPIIDNHGPLRIRHRPFGLARTNASSCPTAVILVPVAARRLSGVKRSFILRHELEEMCQKQKLNARPPLLVESDVFQTPAVVVAVDHDRQTLDVGPAEAGGAVK